MATLRQMQERVKSLVSDFDAVSNKAIDSVMPEIIELNKDQILGGKTREEQDITPNYRTDPFFKTEKAGLGYAKWKMSLERRGLTPISKGYTRSFTAPNIFIRGDFHDGIYGKAMGRYILFGATGFGSSFDTKWPKIFGLTPKNVKIVAPKLTVKYIDMIKAKLNI